MTTLIVAADGQVRCLYDEAIDLKTLGPVRIVRAGSVEPDRVGRWWADLSAVGGPVLGPFSCRSRAVAAERRWLGSHLETGSLPLGEDPFAQRRRTHPCRPGKERL